MTKKQSAKTIEHSIQQLVKQYFKHRHSDTDSGFLYAEIIARTERELIIQVLAQTAENQSQTAKALGISRTTLRKKMQEFDLMDTDK